MAKSAYANPIVKILEDTRSPREIKEKYPEDWDNLVYHFEKAVFQLVIQYPYIWPPYCLYHSVPELMGVLLHELFHCIFFHISRGNGYDPLLRNIAMDYAVNLMVNDAARELEHITEPMSEDHYGRVKFYVPIG